MINETRIIEEFMKLTRIDSETRNERKIADYLIDKLQVLGLEVFEDDTGNKIGGNAGNLIAQLKGKKEGPKIVFSAHMDTVQPGQGIEPIIVDNAIKSKGDTILGADDKAGISAIIELLEVLKEEEINHIPIQVIFTVAEEGGLHGAKNLKPEYINGDFAYVLDSAGSAGHIVVQGPAQNQLEAVVTGKAAHAGMAPQEGINAIQIAARGIARMKLGKVDEVTTANIGIIKGGKATNIIPDKVEIEGEARSLDEEKLDKQCQHMKDCLMRSQEELGGQVEVNIIPNYPSIKIDEKENVIILAQKAALNLGFPFSLEKTGGGSDANILNGYGIPTANLGIGMEKVHTTEEYITIDNLVKNAIYLLEIVKVASE